MDQINEDYHEFVNIDNEEAAYEAVVRRLLSAVRRGELEPGEWVLIEDDGISIGKYEDFDSDSLYGADRVEDLVDLDSGEIIGDNIIRYRVGNLFG